MPDGPKTPSTLHRACQVASLVGLGLAALWVWLHLHSFATTRFFTVDEHQYAHATWLVADGNVPYRDFYEHHFPGSYGLHAPFLPESGPLVERARFFRTVPFAYLSATLALLALATWRATRSAQKALLCAILAGSSGFSAMSAVEYRADNFGACWLLAGLSLLECNRRPARRGLALVAGACFAVSVLMTQKMLVLAGATAAAMWGRDLLRHARNGATVLPFVVRPAFAAAGAALPLVAAIVAAAAAGVLGRAFEITIAQAVTHEASYPPVSVWKYALPFLVQTAGTTMPLLLFAGVHCAIDGGSPCLLPTVVAIVAGAFVQAQYPYNYVLVCVLLVVAATRGIGWLAERVGPRDAAWRPLVYLLPLALLPDQLDFTANRTSNAHQLHVLEKLDRFSAPDDVVIDGAGAAIFRPHASYYWYHGVAHRTILADYFRDGLLRDLRASRARFWLLDFRLPKVSPEVAGWLHAHYVRADGQLFALGFETPATGASARASVVDVIREDVYFVYPRAPDAASASKARKLAQRVTIDGTPGGADGIRLAEGRHRVIVEPGSPAGVLTPLPRGLFEDPMPEILPHAPLFEFARRP